MVDLASLMRYTHMMNLCIQTNRRGFTLIEMMTVIVIIIILAGITVAGMSFVNDKQATALAKVQIGLLSAAIEQYKADNGNYPGELENSPLDGDISEELYNALFHEGWDSKTNGDGSIPIYLKELDPRSGKQTLVQKTSTNIPPLNLEIIDPWGRPYLYRKGTLAFNPDYDLWSRGKDGETELANPEKTVGTNRDDIRNF